MSAPCDCFVARHPNAAEIDAALRAREDPRAVAERFGIGKSRVYDHRKHLFANASTLPQDTPKASHAEPDKAVAASRVAGAIEAPTKAPAPPVESFHGTVERRVESGGMKPVAVPGPPRALPPATDPGAAKTTPATGYLQAVEACVGLITEAQWRASHIRGIAERFGISVDRARHAYHEATRHLQLDMGGYLQKHATSTAWVVRHRNEAKARAESASQHAERWRRQEREAQERADKAQGEERFAALDQAARYGLLATKYDLSAEKWSAQALAHQRHLDDVLCLRSPKELTQNNINIGGDGAAMLERFGSELARRFADRPEVLREIEGAAAAIERGDEGAIEVTGEAA